jgi:Leucine rich repeat
MHLGWRDVRPQHECTEAKSWYVPCCCRYFPSCPCIIAHLTCFSVLLLDENNMRGVIPNELQYLEYLEELDLDDNSLIGHFPGWVGSMKRLEKLDLDRNILSGPIPEELYQSTSLEFVDLDRNILSGTISTQIGRMSQLIFFQVDFNQMIGTIPTEIGNLPNLQYLSVFGNGFDESTGIPLEICGLNIQIYSNCEMCTDVGDCCTVCLPDPTPF